MSNSVSPIALHNPELHRPLDGRYQIVEILAARLWGRTYLAQDLRRPSQPECIIHQLKTIPDIPDYSATVRCIFAREAAILEEFGEHEQMPELLACFEDEDGFYVVQEFISGYPLSVELRSGAAWSAAEVEQLLLELLKPLAVVHRYGSVHGNLKPGNILRRPVDHRLVLIDFGSMPQIQLSLMTAYGQEVAPPDATQQSYQPLEQLQGFPRPASDVYAVGMMGIQALTGMAPTEFQINPDTGEIAWQTHCNAADSALDRELIQLLDRMVQWDLSQRFSCAGDALQALQNGVNEESAQVVQPVSLESMEPIPTTALAHSLATALSTNALAINALAINTPPITLLAEPTAIAVKAISPDRDILGNAETGDAAIDPAEIDQTSPQPAPAALPPLPTLSASNPVSNPTPNPAPNPAPQKPPFQFLRLLLNLGTTPSVQLGAGGMLLTFVLAAASWNLLASTDWAQKGNDFWQSIEKKRQAKRQLAQAGSNAATTAIAYQSVKMMASNWQQEWSTATVLVGQAERSLEQGKFTEVRQLSQQLPPIPYWQDRSAALVQQATAKAESQSAQQLQTAYDYARTREFTKALKVLRQIPPGTSLAETIQQKTQEYREKQQIRAQADLQQAYDRATIRDFTNAIPYLRQIPKDTSTYAIAQQKIAEYTEKQRIRAQTLLISAAEQAEQHQLQAALTSLAEIPDGTPIDAAVDAKLADYTNQFNQQAEEWLQQANRKALAGNLPGAIADWQKVPIGTPAYAEARNKIAIFSPITATQKGTQASGSNPGRIAAQDINPGNQLRETAVVF